MRVLRAPAGWIAVVSIVLVAFAASRVVATQGQRPPSEARRTGEFSAKTPWGHPDLQAIWDFRTVTPMERPTELGDKAVLTENEAREFEQRAVASRDADQQRG